MASLQRGGSKWCQVSTPDPTLHSYSAHVIRILSYINNLHPQKHNELYKVIEQIIDKAIPLWDTTLAPLQASSSIEPRIPYLRCEHELVPGESQSSEDEMLGAVIQPEPENFALRVLKGFRGFDCPNAEIDLEGNPKINLRNDFAAQGLQIIVKLANIHLTPEKPTYDGGVWHVEGQLVRFSVVLFSAMT